MVRTKPKPRYQAVSLPEEFVEKVRKHVLKSDNYQSIAEFTKIAVQEKMANDKADKLRSYFERPKQTVFPDLQRELKGINDKLGQLLEKQE